MKIIGMDLGTTFSLATVYNPDTKQVTVIPDDSGGFVVPSVVYYPESGEAVVGQEAVNAGDYAGDRLVRCIKMNMGTDFRLKLGGREYTPAEVSSEILKKLKKNVETYFNIGPDTAADFWRDASVVITVPAYFEDKQNIPTREAARLAGFDMSKVRLFPEPCAAALAYLAEADTNLGAGPRRILVSDLGGGTYDVTMIETKPIHTPEGRTHLEINVTCKDGSQQLGGVLWDDALEEYLKEQCAGAVADGHSGINSQDPSLAHALRERVIRGKVNLSSMDPVKIACCIGKNQEITREAFEEQTAHLLEQVEKKLRTVLREDQEQQRREAEKEGKKEEEVKILTPDTVLLAGGASHMPQVKALIRAVTGLDPLTHKGLEQIVAIGAAYEAAIITKSGDPDGQDGEQDAVVVHTLGGIIIHSPKSILGVPVGVKAKGMGRYMNVLVLEKGEREGEERTNRIPLGTEVDNQSAIQFTVLQGEDGSDANDCIVLGEASLALPPHQPMGTKVEVFLKLGDSLTIIGRGVCYTTEGPRDCQIEIKREGITRPE